MLTCSLIVVKASIYDVKSEMLYAMSLISPYKGISNLLLPITFEFSFAAQSSSGSIDL